MAFIDRYGRALSICHRLHPLCKLAMAMSVIVTAISLSVEAWPIQGLLACVVFVGLTLADVPVSYLLRRLVLFLPMLFLLTISLPASQGFASGWELMFRILIRSTVAFLTMLWLINVMPFDQLLATLRRLKVPDVLLATLSFMYRYIYVLWDELDKMLTARRAREFSNRRGWRYWKTSAQMLGLLLIRSMQRAERVHGAMLARGWDGQVRFFDDRED